MRILLQLSAVACIMLLAACQTTAPRLAPTPAPVDPPPPAVSSQHVQRAAPANAAATSGQQRSSAVITLHLAQQRQEPSLIPVHVGAADPLYALPQPVLTQADIARVSPVTAQDNRTFLMLEMTPQGASKLRNVTEQARGHYLLLSVQGQLASVAQIGEVVSDGRLLVGTQGPAHRQAILRLMQGN